MMLFLANDSIFYKKNRGNCKLRQDFITPDLAEKILEIAQAAGHAIMDVYTAQHTPEHTNAAISFTLKSDESPLTQADMLSHQIILKALTQLTPDIPVVSEEDSASWVHRNPHTTFWLIDPLDGTKEFIAKNGEFTVNIALIQEGTSIFGVVGAPALDLIYWGGLGLGAFRNQSGMISAIQTNKTLSQPIHIVASKSHLNPETLEFIEQFPAHQLVQAGSSLKFCRIAEGTADCYPRLAPTCEWDTAAAQAIVEAAGGYVCTVDGKTLCYGKPDVLNPAFVATAIPLNNLRNLK